MQVSVIACPLFYLARGDLSSPFFLLLLCLTETAQDIVKEHLLSVREVHIGAEDSTPIIVALWELLRAVPDPLTRTHIILAVRHLIPIASEAPDYEYVNELVQMLGQGVSGLNESMATSTSTADR